MSPKSSKRERRDRERETEREKERESERERERNMVLSLLKCRHSVHIGLASSNSKCFRLNIVLS